MENPNTENHKLKTENHKLKLVRGWTLLRGSADYRRWHECRKAYHASPAPAFPCLVKEVLASDEETSYDYLTEGMLSDMRLALASPREPSQEGS